MHSEYNKELSPYKFMEENISKELLFTVQSAVIIKHVKYIQKNTNVFRIKQKIYLLAYI